MSLLIRNIGLLATAVGNDACAGARQGAIRTMKNAWLLIEGERIAALGEGAPPDAQQTLDAGGRLATAGLVDAHTHLIFGGWRQNELALKLHGVPYLDILAQGGGILSTVNASRAASQEALAEKAERALREMLRFGTTTCEAKSGYGLSLEEEQKELRAIRDLKERQPVELAATFLGAHAVPKGADRAAYVRTLCEEMIPAVAREGLAEFCDVFCETGVFSAEESRAILEAGKRHGLIPKIHADEIDSIGGSQLAGDLGAISAEHLIVCPDEGIERMARGGTVACLLPCTSFYLGAAYAPAAKMIEAGVPVAMATDFNPGSCPCLNMQLVMNLGCLKYRLTPEQVLTAVTLNGAAAIGRAARIGSLEVGKQADLLLWEAPDLNYICYRMGSNLVSTVIKRGTVLEV